MAQYQVFSIFFHFNRVKCLRTLQRLTNYADVNSILLDFSCPIYSVSAGFYLTWGLELVVLPGLKWGLLS